MKDFIKNLQFIFRTAFWLMNEPFNKEWDKKLNELLDKHEFTEKSKYTAKLGNYTIWIKNYPYSCFMPYSESEGTAPFRASRLTILRCKEKIGYIPKVNEYDFGRFINSGK